MTQGPEKILILKRMVADLLHLYGGAPSADGAMDGIRDLVEKETGNRDIPLEYYEASDDWFLRRVVSR
jgi:hypothetical protein